MKAILEQQEIDIINQILTDFPIRQLDRVKQIMEIIESKIETEEAEEVEGAEAEES